MTERQPVSKKLRFEVFKRDAFTCQYCGRKSPDVVLRCDHVRPVADGGPSDILNLITACFDCNAGKGARTLSDNAVLSKQMDQLAELQERRAQLDMMIEWRDELQRLDDDTVAAIEERIAGRYGFNLTENGRNLVRKWLKKYSVTEVLSAADEALAAYLQIEKDKPTDESWNKAFDKIPAFVSLMRQEKEKPYIRRLVYIQAIIRRRSRHRRYDCINYLEHLHLAGLPLDELEQRAKRMRLGDLDDFEGPLDQWLAEMGKPF